MEVIHNYLKKDDNNILGMILNMLFKGLSLLLSVIYVPVVLGVLGSEKNGVWMTILSVLSWVSFFDVGIGNGLKNKLTENLANNKSCKSLVSSAFFIFLIIASIIFVVFIIISNYIDWNIVLGIGVCDENLKFIVCICVTFVSINFIFSNCRVLLYAMHKSYLVGLLEIISQFIFLLFVYLFKNLAKQLLVLSVFYGISLLFVNLFCCIIIININQDFCPSINTFSFEQGKLLSQIGLKFFIVQVCALILFSTDNLIISILFGAKSVTPYSIVIKIFSVIIGVHSAFLNPVWTDVTRAKEINDIEYIRHLLFRVIIYIIPFIIFSIIIFLNFDQLLSLWLGYSMKIPRLLIIFGFLYCVFSLWCNTWACFTNGLELLNFSVIFAVIQAVFNIPLSCFFAVNLNLDSSGVLLGTIVSMVIAAIAAPIRIALYIYKRKE